MAGYSPIAGPSNATGDQERPRDLSAEENQTATGHHVAPSIRSGYENPRLPVWGRRRNSDSAPESPWARKILLTLGM